MAIYKCKMCSGELDVQEGVSVIECDYCGIKQTVPTAKDESLQGLFNRANILRMKSEFDKAEQIYEKILQADETQAEAYWGLILCKYGIEYVEDPKTFTRIPTCHRTSFDSIIADDDYKSALQYADGVQRGIYEAEAKEIDRLQKEILTLSQKEEPYDVFICYKETDVIGRRTQDSVAANDMYYQLTNEGFKVFYAAITLEEKLGSAYEPCIFAALNSAKVMLAVGTKPEHFNAVWVKNEWSRFLKMMKVDRSKILIPCYKDMDAYELPEEFAHLQAQDMSKIGFVNDLVRGIKKVIIKDTSTSLTEKGTVIAGEKATTEPLLKRVFMFLEDGDWSTANEYCEKVLDIDPENAEAYVGKLMADLKIKKQESLKELAETFEDNSNYQKAIRFADEKLKTVLVGYNEYIETRQNEAVYNRAKAEMSAADTVDSLRDAARRFGWISEYKDSAALAEECYGKAQEIEEERKKCEELLEALKTACRNEKKSMSQKAQAEKSVAKLTRRHQQLLEIRSNWSTIEANVTPYNNEIQTVQEEISRLEKEKASLGLFAGKRKKEVAAEIAKFEEISRVVKQKKADEESKKGGFSSLELLGNELSQTEEEICAQNKRIAEISAAANSHKIRDELSNYTYGRKLLESFNTYFGVVITVGESITFGSYPQTGTGEREEIEWIVLEVKDERALVLSKYALDCKPYNTNPVDVTWETCTLRAWLNNEFINTAFSADERAKIPTVRVSADKNPKYDTNPGNPTQDKVFLLSVSEYETYFSIVKTCYPTAHAVANGVDDGAIFLWLRTPGAWQNWAADFYYGGEGDWCGSSVEDDNAVRPAIWIDLNA